MLLLLVDYYFIIIIIMIIIMIIIITSMSKGKLTNSRGEGHRERRPEPRYPPRPRAHLGRARGLLSYMIL